MTRTQFPGLVAILLCGGLSIMWGLAMRQNAPVREIDFKAVYYGTQFLLQGHDPYRQKELDNYFCSVDEDARRAQARFREGVNLYVNLPSTFVLVAPLAVLPFRIAYVLWLSLMVTSLFIASYLMWRVAATYCSGFSFLLICIVLANSEVVIGTANTAGIIVGLCIIAAWTFLEDRFVYLGILCMAVSLVIKPHDAGFVWLFFLLAGGTYRKHALQSLAVTFAIFIVGFGWISYVVPHWILEWRSNMVATASSGGLNEPGISSVTGNSAGMIIDLQSAFSVIRNDPHFFDTASYLICGFLLLLWIVCTLRIHMTKEKTWIAFAAVVPLTMLVTYHRPYDAKLLLLSIPACAILWSRRGIEGWTGAVLSLAAVISTSDVPLATLVTFSKNLHIDSSLLSGKLLTVMLRRPTPIILLVMGIFYLWVYVRRTGPEREGVEAEEAVSA